MDSILSIYEMDITKDDITITYTPSKLVKNYEYTILKNNRNYKIVTVSKNQISNILLSETGSYQIKITEYYEFDKKEIVSGLYNIDKEAPILEVGDTNLKLKQGKKIDIMGGVKASDNTDGDITSFVITNEKDINFNKIGNHRLTYTVSDKAGNEVSKSININVVKDDTVQLLISQTFILLSLLLILIYIIKYNKSLLIEKRIAKYTLKPIKDHSKSLFGNAYRFTTRCINRITKILNKSYFIKKISKRYKKYVRVFGKEHDTTVTIISQKIIVSIIFLIVVIIAKTIRLQVLYFYEMIVPILIGYYLLDFIYEYKYRLYRKKIENDFLQAVIVMNNAFKSGRSITQAIDLVSTELKGPIAEEFKKISLDISFGLDIEVAFKRFASRIELDEAAYLTASLSITNRTGGNITRVFSSIEKNLFNRKKLKLELKSLTSSSRLIMYILMVIPILFVVIINLINPTYFVPLFTNPLGILLIFIMILIYISYIIIVRKVIKVRM